MTEDDEPTYPRSIAWAMICDALVPGLGHWYLGAISQAIAIAALYLMAFPALIVAIAASGRGLAFALWLALAGVGLLRLLTAAHAGFIAKRTGAIELQKAHTLGGYLAFVVLTASLGQFEVALLRASVLDSLRVPADSGQPNIGTDDHILITRLGARDHAGQRGDLIVFPLPDRPATFVKRVVALEGETVSVIDGVVSIDGVVLATSPCEDVEGLVLPDRATCLRERTPEGASYRIQLDRTQDRPLDFPPTPVPAGHVFVLGDHRFGSHDSRAFGPIPKASITGRARAIWRPLARASSLDPD